MNRRGPQFTAAQIEDLLGIPAATVRSWVHRGQITGRRGLVDGRSLYDYLTRRGHSALRRLTEAEVTELDEE